jgi:hypothetical protein
MNRTTQFHVAAQSAIALAACMSTAGAAHTDTTALTTLSVLAEAAAQRLERDESLDEIARIWRHPTYAVDLHSANAGPAPWALVSAESLAALRAAVADLAGYAPALRELDAELAVLVKRLTAQPDPRIALVAHVLAKRCAKRVREFEKAARITREAREAARKEEFGVRAYAAREALDARGVKLMHHPEGRFSVLMGGVTTHRCVSLDAIEEFIASLPPAAVVA